MKAGKLIIPASFAALAAAALVAMIFCCYRASLPIEIDPNEAWNAWQSRSLAQLYPNPNALTINNYPPLYFYLLHLGSLLGAEEIYAGRALSLLSSLVLTFLVYRMIVILGMTQLAAFSGAIWFLATLAGAYTGYTGMNDPHLAALAVMCGAFTWFIASVQKERTAVPAVLLMVLGGFIKHTLIAIPASALVWLAFDSPRRALRAAIAGLIACAAGLLICTLAYGGNFIEQLMMPRVVGWKNLHLALAYLKPLIGGIAIAAIWLAFDRRNPLARKMAVFLGLTFLTGFVQALGDGVDINAFFEFLFVLAIAVGAAFNKIQALPPAKSWRTDVIKLVFAGALLVPLLLSSQTEPYRLLFSHSFRKELAENAEAVGSEVKRLKKIKGDVSCTVMLVCYWAGKRFVWDDFAMKERVRTGRWTESEMKRQARLHHIRFETIDERTVW